MPAPRAPSAPTWHVRFEGNPDGTTTRVSYDADAVVGGMVGGVGQRMLTCVSRRMAAEFFGNVEKPRSRAARRPRRSRDRRERAVLDQRR